MSSFKDPLPPNTKQTHWFVDLLSRKVISVKLDILDCTPDVSPQKGTFNGFPGGTGVHGPTFGIPDSKKIGGAKGQHEKQKQRCPSQNPGNESKCCICAMWCTHWLVVADAAKSSVDATINQSINQSIFICIAPERGYLHKQYTSFSASTHDELSWENM